MTFEEIRRLQNDLAMAKEIIKNQKKQISKGRKIVAMLFWEWKEADRLLKTYVDYDYLPIRTARKDEAYYCFEEAYKILKEGK